MLRDHVRPCTTPPKAIDLKIPMSEEEMGRAVVETCRANRTLDGYIRLVVTRGPGSLGLSPYRCQTPQVIIIADAIQLYPPECYEKGLKIVTVGTVRNAPEAVNPRIKSLNYLNNILAKIEAINAGVEEALMLNAAGYVAEATGDNVFFVRGGVLATPHPTAGCLEGITRNAVIEIARAQGLSVQEPTQTSRYDLYTADEVFLSGSAAELIPVVEIDRRQIGSGRPGPVTKTLLEQFRASHVIPRTGKRSHEVRALPAKPRHEGGPRLQGRQVLRAVRLRRLRTDVCRTCGARRPDRGNAVAGRHPLQPRTPAGRAGVRARRTRGGGRRASARARSRPLSGLRPPARNSPGGAASGVPCYDTFEDDVKTLLRELQYDDHHVGRKPGKTARSETLAALEADLAEAVRREDFSRAAVLRNLLARHRPPQDPSGNPADGDA